MSEIVTVITALVQGGGLFFLLKKIIEGLKIEIKTLQTTIEQQKETLEVMEKRILETEKIGEIYRKLIRDLPEDLEKYKEIIQKTKDEAIKTLQEANKEKNQQLEEVSKLKIKEIEIQEKIIQEIPVIHERFRLALKEIEDKMAILDSPYLQANRVFYPLDQEIQYFSGTSRIRLARLSDFYHIGNYEVVSSFEKKEEKAPPKKE